MGALPPKIAALLNKGLASHKAGDLQAAMASYNAVLKKKPFQPDALWLMGVALIGTGDIPAAVEWLKRAIKHRPQDAAIWNDLGMAQEAAGNLQAALEAFKTAVNLDPQLPAALVNVARYVLEEGNPEEALIDIERALKVQPQLVEAHNTRGLALSALGREGDALKSFSTALTYAPADAAVLFNKGELLRKKGDVDGAQVFLKRAVLAGPKGSLNWAKATMTLGSILAQSGQEEAALIQYDAVLRGRPDHIETLVNRGELKRSQGDIKSAAADFLAALEVDSACAEAKLNLSFLHLLQRKWAEGWDGHEARWLVDDVNSVTRSHGLPAWNGSLTAGLRLLVWGEQGLGDQILFSEQLVDIISGGITLRLEVDRRLVLLFERSFPGVSVLEYDSIPPEEFSSFDAQIALGSLGQFLRRSSESFPKSKPYLMADTEQTDRLRQKYLERAAGRAIVGVAWHSINPRSGLDKSLPLDQWKTILSNRNALFVSLQYGDVRNVVAEVSQLTGADILIDEDVDPFSDFDAAAAQVAATDLVISTSNTAVHLAGALGKKVWLMVPAIPEWRWGLEGASVPWYPRLTLFRQEKRGEWSPVLAQVSAALTNWISGD